MSQRPVCCIFLSLSPVLNLDVCVCVSVCVCVCACMCACMCACVCVRVRVWKENKNLLISHRSQICSGQLVSYLLLLLLLSYTSSQCLLCSCDFIFWGFITYCKNSVNNSNKWFTDLLKRFSQTSFPQRPLDVFELGFVRVVHKKVHWKYYWSWIVGNNAGPYSFHFCTNFLHYKENASSHFFFKRTLLNSYLVLLFWKLYYFNKL